MARNTPRDKDLPPLAFGTQSAQEIDNEMRAAYPRPLGEADPRLALLRAAGAPILQANLTIDNAVKATLVSYAEDAELDYIGRMVDTPRIGATPASLAARWTLSAPRAVNTRIPKGTRVAHGADQFALDEDLIIPADVSAPPTAVARMVATAAGALGAPVYAGAVLDLVDQNSPYVDTIRAESDATGGFDEEDDDAYADRIRLSSDRVSVAGPRPAYEAIARGAIPNATVYAEMPDDRAQYTGTVHGAPWEIRAGVVNVYVLQDGEPLPDAYDQDANGQSDRYTSPSYVDLALRVYEALSAERVRPATDKVVICKPIPFAVSWRFRYEEGADFADPALVDEAVARFVKNTEGQIGRPANPDELRRILRDMAGVRYIDLVDNATGKQPVYTRLDRAQSVVIDVENQGVIV